MKKILCMGETYIEMVSYPKDKTFYKSLSGAPFNVACAISKLKGDVRFLTKLAKDSYGHDFIKAFDDYGIDHEHVVLDGAYKTALIVNEEKDYHFYLDHAPYLNLNWKELYPHLLEDIDLVHFGGACLMDGPMKAVHHMVLDNAQSQDLIISFDPNLKENLYPNKSLLKESILEFLPYCKILKLSEEELEFISGIESITASMNYLFNRFLNLELIIYTKAERGANIYFKDHSMLNIEALKGINKVDDLAVGDAFMGAFLVTLSRYETIDLKDKKQIYTSLVAANAYAGLSLEKKGGIDAFLDLKQFKEALKNH